MLIGLVAFSLAQAVVGRADMPADAATAAEMIQRPPGLSTSAFLDRLIEEAGAGGWERQESVGPYRGVEVRIVGLRRVQGDGLMFFAPAAEDATGNLCRIRRVREGPTERDADRVIEYCLGEVAAGH